MSGTLGDDIDRLRAQAALVRRLLGRLADRLVGTPARIRRRAAVEAGWLPFTAGAFVWRCDDGGAV